jgi:hypothetical protein
VVHTCQNPVRHPNLIISSLLYAVMCPSVQACVVHATGQFIDQTFAGRRVPLEDAGL